jgi:predicted Zn-dependent peptidase
MQESVKTVVLPNGVRVLLVPRTGVESVMVEVKFAAGSCLETDALSGTAHFLEHMEFRGTIRRPSATIIFRELDTVGAASNAFTCQDQTAYHVRLEAGQLPLAVDMLADLTLNSLIREEDMAIERGAILEEARSNLDNPSHLAYWQMHAAAYPGMALGRPIIGTLETISALTPDHLLAFRARHYLPSRTLVVIVGKFDETEALRLVKGSFGAWHPGITSVGMPQELVELAPQPVVAMHHKPEAEQANIALGFRAYGHDHPRLAALDLLCNILGGTTSSRLHISVRQDRGLAYSVGSFTEAYRGTGLLSVMAGLAKDQLTPAIGVIVDELARLKSEGVAPEELARAKTNARGGLALASETSSFLSEFYGDEELFSSAPRSFGSYLDALEAVTPTDVLDVARDVIRASTFRLGIVSPFDDPEPYLALAAKLGD